MQYDTVSKLWIEQCAKQFLRELVGVKTDHFETVEEAAQEQPSMNKADYVLKVNISSKHKEVFVIEFLTHWLEEKLIDLTRYTLFCKKKFRLRMRPVLVLFLPHAKARNCYSDECTRFRFQLIKLYELDAADFFLKHIPELYPLIPLMKGGVGIAEEVNRKLLESDLPRLKKADLLAVLTVFLGLRDKAKASKVFKEQKERMDVFSESPIFKMVMDLRREEGREQGRAEGRQEGRVEGLRGAIQLGLEIRFGRNAAKVLPLLKKSSNLTLLEAASEGVKEVGSIDEFRSRYFGKTPRARKR